MGLCSWSRFQHMGACHRPSVTSGVVFHPLHYCCHRQSSVLSEAGEVKRPQPSQLSCVQLETEPSPESHGLPF